MADRQVTIWYDAEGGFLEVTFDRRPGYYRETTNVQVMQKVGDQGRLLGFSVLRVSSARDKPLEVALRQP